MTRGASGQVRSRIEAFRADRIGDVTLIFALAAIPVIGAVAVTVDYSHANAARTAMQAALDAITLMVSKEVLDLKSTQVRKKARTYFNRPVPPPDGKNLMVTFSTKTNGPGDFAVVSKGTGALDTSMAQVIGYSSMDMRANAQVVWTSGRSSLRLPSTIPDRWQPRTRWSS